MSQNDPLAGALSHLVNCENIARKEAYLSPISKTLKSVLGIMKEQGYIGSFSEVADSGGRVMKVNLVSKLNRCGVIKPRFALKRDSYEKYEKRFLPAKGFGVLIVSTTKGITTHDKAKDLGLGGKLIAYCY